MVWLRLSNTTRNKTLNLTKGKTESPGS